MKRLSWILTLPLMLVVVAFAVTNRQEVTLDLLWPLEFRVPVRLSLAILLSLFAGLLVGGLAAWLTAGRTRRRARAAERRAGELEREIARLKRERDRGGAAPTPGLEAAPRGREQGAKRATLPAIGS